MVINSSQQKDNYSSIIRLTDVQSEEVEWLWYPYIPLRKITSLEGDPGIGKSTVGLAIGTGVSLGKGLPGSPEIKPADVLLASAEDGLEDTIRPRLEKMGADLARIHAIQGILNFTRDGIDRLRKYIKVLNPELVIIDPMVAYIGGAIDIYRANETREIMARLSDVAEENCVAILIVRHLTKAYQLRAIYRGQGSIDITAACRSVLLAGCNPQDERERALFHIKSNLAPLGKPIGFKIVDGRFSWTGESALTVYEVLSSEPDVDKTAFDEAVEFLLEELKCGSVEASQVWKDAKELNLAEKTVKRAKKKLGIITYREGETGKKGGGKFSWKLPETVSDDLGGQTSIYKEFGPLNSFSLKNTENSAKVDPLNDPLNNDNHNREFAT
ncbi:AAA family ATPase [Chloroflexota bacterium]